MVALILAIICSIIVYVIRKQKNKNKSIAKVVQISCIIFIVIDFILLCVISSDKVELALNPNKTEVLYNSQLIEPSPEHPDAYLEYTELEKQPYYLYYTNGNDILLYAKKVPVNIVFTSKESDDQVPHIDFYKIKNTRIYGRKPIAKDAYISLINYINKYLQYYGNKNVGPHMVTNYNDEVSRIDIFIPEGSLVKN